MKHQYFPALYIGLLRWNFTHSYTFFATLQSHLITMISTCSLQIPWKHQSPWVKSKRLTHKATQLAVKLEFVSLHLFSAHLLFLTSTIYKVSCCCDRCNIKFWFKILQTCYPGFWRKMKQGWRNRENTRISYLLLVVRCVWQHGRNMEHNFIVFVCCVQRMGSSGVSYSEKQTNKKEWWDDYKNRKNSSFKRNISKKKKKDGLGWKDPRQDLE